MDRRAFLETLTVGLLATPLGAGAQPTTKIYRVGVVLQGGPYYLAVDGLRAGLKELGFEERKHYTLLIRDVKGDLGGVAEAARSLEKEKVDLIYAVGTSVVVAVQRATTTEVPIVFYGGRDPVDSGLVKSLANPRGRVTGVDSRANDLAPKRLEILKETIPRLRRVLTFYDPSNVVAQDAVAEARQAALRVRVEFVERSVHSVDDLRARVLALKSGEVDALFTMGDGMVISQAKFIAETAKARKLPTMFPERTAVVEGGLISYGPSFYAAGQLGARYVHRVLLGTSPAGLPVERLDRFELVLNARTAREIGLTIPPSLLARADQVIE